MQVFGTPAARRLLLIRGSFAGKDDARSLGQDVQIEPWRPVPDVVFAQPRPPAERKSIPPGNLPETREPWPHPCVELHISAVSHLLVAHNWARADETHLSPEDFDDLRQLIKT